MIVVGGGDPHLLAGCWFHSAEITFNYDRLLLPIGVFSCRKVEKLSVGGQRETRLGDTGGRKHTLRL